MINNTSKFTSRLENILENSNVRALVLKKKQIELEDIFWSASLVKGSISREVLSKAGFDFKSDEIVEDKKKAKMNRQKLDFSPNVRQVIQKSVSLAVELEHKYVGTEHLLFSLLEVRDKKIDNILEQHKVNKQKIFDQLEIVFQSVSGFGQMANVAGHVKKMLDNLNMPDDLSFSKSDILSLSAEDEIVEVDQTKNQGVLTRIKKKKNKKSSILDHYTRNLTDSQVQQGIDPVIGRESEIKRVIQILSRRIKNNPVLLGEAGVGKTAIVEGLAKKIVDGNVPDVLLDKKIYALDLNLLVAGAVMRGEFEMRLKQIIDEVKKDPNIILFIDEIHNIVGAGSVTGTMDAANILKPTLARGDLRCIGATTYEEYKKHIENDSALDRRFQPVLVNEPNKEQAIAILQGIKDKYEKHHMVEISQAAIRAAVELSERYLPEKLLPDKAIDLIDEAAAYVKLRAGVINEDLRKLKFLEQKIEQIGDEKVKKIGQEDYKNALVLKEKETRLWDEFFHVEDKISNQQQQDKTLGVVKVDDVAQVLSDITGLPLSNLVDLPSQKMAKVRHKLDKKIIGQSEVLSDISFYLKKSSAGLASKNRPLGCFMFLGSSGVGKTYTAKVLADEIFGFKGNKSSLIRFDMSEFSEKFNISRLIGSPAGYVGFREGGNLTEPIRRNPYSVVLFDEIEKAHPEVFNLLLQILDEGFLTDATGKKVDFRNAIIILTSNLGVKKLNQASLGFGSDGINQNKEVEIFEQLKQDMLKEVEDHFRPEFLNRLDKILMFKPLSLKSVEKIVELELKALSNDLKDKKIKLNWTAKVVKQIAEQAYSPTIGARNIKRFIEQNIEGPIVDMILEGKVGTDGVLKIDVVGDKIKIKNI